MSRSKNESSGKSINSGDSSGAVYLTVMAMIVVAMDRFSCKRSEKKEMWIAYVRN